MDGCFLVHSSTTSKTWYWSLWRQTSGFSDDNEEDLDSQQTLDQLPFYIVTWNIEHSAPCWVTHSLLCLIDPIIRTLQFNKAHEFTQWKDVVSPPEDTGSDNTTITQS